LPTAIVYAWINLSPYVFCFRGEYFCEDSPSVL
jgi:hypothetical protein